MTTLDHPDPILQARGEEWGYWLMQVGAVFVVIVLLVWLSW